ncbi:MAG: hypothetical protein B7Z02_09420 [Rhodobacterales bacterium 32-67-9]|nr:MAG: hypothetical protein B7Z02_09420 [Rhodobacterales bacterium 32-67-9]
MTSTFAHSGSTADIAFFANGVKWQAGMDESWAIDNLRVSINAPMAPVPLPGSLAALAGGLGFLVAGRRRRTQAIA